MSIDTLEKLLIEELRDIFSAENQILKALPKLARAASSPQLKEAFQEHLAETVGQVERLEAIAEKMKIKLSGKLCKAMRGLLEEGKEAIDEDCETDALKDMLLISAAQRVEHYEMAAYGNARAIAEQLGMDQVVKSLQATLNEEGAADKKLTAISSSEILADACGEEEIELGKLNLTRSGSRANAANREASTK